MLAFVYGTLKKGKPNHYKMVGADYVREYTLPVKGFLYWLEGRNYPHFVADEDGGFINGELYTVSDKKLIDLDYFEGHPTFFKRHMVLDGEDEIYYYEYVNYKNNPREDLKGFVKIKKY